MEIIPRNFNGKYIYLVDGARMAWCGTMKRRMTVLQISICLLPLRGQLRFKGE